MKDAIKNILSDKFAVKMKINIVNCFQFVNVMKVFFNASDVNKIPVKLQLAPNSKDGIFIYINGEVYDSHQNNLNGMLCGAIYEKKVKNEENLLTSNDIAYGLGFGPVFGNLVAVDSCFVGYITLDNEDFWKRVIKDKKPYDLPTFVYDKEFVVITRGDCPCQTRRMIDYCNKSFKDIYKFKGNGIKLIFKIMEDGKIGAFIDQELRILNDDIEWIDLNGVNCGIVCSRFPNHEVSQMELARRIGEAEKNNKSFIGYYVYKIDWNDGVVII